MRINIKLIVSIIIILLFVALGWIGYSQRQQIQELQKSLNIAINNNKAYEIENSDLNGKIIEFQLTSQQLEYSKDLLLEKLNSARKSLNVKDKQLRELQYLASENHKTDTIFMKDTIFKSGVAIDTSITDDWSRLTIHAEYPNILSADYSFKNSTIVIAHGSRVTIDPPKKCWIGRLFQKKQDIVEINVVHENPYCETKSEKFIKILQKN